jgi:hypothetical protein
MANWSRKWLSEHWTAATLVLVDVAVATVAPIIAEWKNNLTWLQVGAAVIAVATFLGVWLLQRHRAAGRAEWNSMRDAIAAAFVLTYLAIVGWVTFIGFYKTDEPKVIGLTSMLVQNFTVLTGVVVGGYFSADAIKQVTRIRAKQGRGQADGSPEESDK